MPRAERRTKKRNDQKRMEAGQLASVTERHPDVFKVLRSGRTEKLMSFSAKLFACCPRPSFSSQSATCCIAAAPRIIGQGHCRYARRRCPSCPRAQNRHRRNHRRSANPMVLKIVEEGGPVGDEAVRLEIAQRKREAVIDADQCRPILGKPLHEPFGDAATRPIFARRR